ncbi:FGGY family carbohydrate kinase [Notoacmeibacter ruber]|uniref:Autoinducer-2 kinase n=1 Tax=Notoacmeibacter ruber TaxID=2670375 RepID=A0A3L7J8V5_9HYPH|nr:FGGY family carbohydrate kinase [Notoacmeibacter ruber]RLQ86854.1 autoinducer-2 kinase [Notoacmeibacter ruber]
MTKRYVIAIDAGTGSGRAIVYDMDGNVAGMAQEEWVHPTVDGVPGGLDFATGPNGELIDRVIGAALQKAGLKGDDIAAVAATSMREGFVLYDKSGQPIWACPNVDSRASTQADLLAESGDADRIYRTAGDWVSITAPARLLWIKENRPEIYRRASRMGMLSDWIATRLSGVYATEPTAGSSSALFDLAKRDWSEELLSIVDFDPSMVPAVSEPGTTIGSVTQEAAKRTGLAQGTPVVTGGGDTQLALLGLGQRGGDATLVGGSFWQMTILSDRPLIDPDFAPRTLCHARPDEWMTEGIGFLSGFTLRWLRDAFFEPLRSAFGGTASAFDIMEEFAARQPPGANGVIATTANPMQSDAWKHPALGFAGFDINQPDMALGSAVRSVMESAAYLASTHLGVLEKLSGKSYEKLHFTGGSSQSPVWSQIVADVTGRPVDIPSVKETTALGAAMLAATGAGLFASLDEAVAAMSSPIERSLEPNKENHEFYRGEQERWRAVSAASFDLAENGTLAPLWTPAGARKD